MSNIQNTIYLEQQHDYFQEALECRYYKTAKNIIKEVEEAGFENVAYEMRRELNVTMEKNYIPDPPRSGAMLRAEESYLRSIEDR